MKTNRNGSVQVVIVALVVIAALAGLYFYFSNTAGNNPAGYAQPQNNTAGQAAPPSVNAAPAINNDQGLMSASQSIDTIDMNQFDSGISQNDADAKTFAPRIRNKNGTSLNWSGYAVETSISSPQNGAVSDVKGSWTVPGVTCAGTNTYSSAWVGIDGYSDNTVEQIGTEQDCINGAPSYYAWYEMYPKPGFRIKLPVKAGDAMSAEVQYIGGNKFRLTLANTTAGKSFSTFQKSNALRQSAEWIMEAPWSGGVLPLADFGAIYFTSSVATLNGVAGTIGASSWQNDPLTMTNGTTTKAAPSALSADGSSFNVQWYSSN